MTETDLPTVTIGITAFNCEDTLRRAVASAFEQDYPNKEILIVDDCSRDSTHDIALELAAAYKDIRVIRAPKNGGVAASRNLIINNTEADFIVFFDDDDVSEPDRISEQLKLINACEEGDITKLVICHSARTVEYSPSFSRYEKGIAQDAGPKGISGPIISEAILCGTRVKELKGGCPTCTQMARTLSYQKLHGFDERLTRSEDTDFSIRAAENDATFVSTKKALVYQKMTKGDEKKLIIERQNWLYLLGKHRSIVERKTDFTFALAWLDLRYMFLKKNHVGFTIALIKLLTSFPKETVTKAYQAFSNLRLHSAMSEFVEENERK